MQKKQKKTKNPGHFFVRFTIRGFQTRLNTNKMHQIWMMDLILFPILLPTLANSKVAQ